MKMDKLQRLEKTHRMGSRRFRLLWGLVLGLSMAVTMTISLSSIPRFDHSFFHLLAIFSLESLLGGMVGYYIVGPFLWEICEERYKQEKRKEQERHGALPT